MNNGDSIAHRNLHTTSGMHVALDELLQGGIDGLLVIGCDLKLLRFNATAQAVFELSEMDVGRPIGEVLGSLDRTLHVVDHVRGWLKGRHAVDGDPVEVGARWFTQSVVSVRGESDEVEAVLVTFRDVSEFLIAEQRFEFAINAAFMNWWLWDMSEDQIQLYPADSNLLGYPSNDLPKDKDGWLEVIHPDDREYVIRNLESNLAGENEFWCCECRMKTADGGWMWVDNRGRVSRRNKEGKPLEMTGTLQDIDATKRAHIDMRSKNDMLEKAAEIIKMGTWEYFPENDQVTWSRQTRRILGVDDKFESSAEAFYKFVHPDDVEKIQTAFNKVVEDGTEYHVRLRCTSLDGRKLLVRTACTARYDLFGNLVRVTGIFQDITGDQMLFDELD